MLRFFDFKFYVFFFTLKMTEYYNCNCYDEYEFDRKQTTNMFTVLSKVIVCLQYCLL